MERKFYLTKALTAFVIFLFSASAQGTTWFDVEIAVPGGVPVLVPDMTDVTVDDIFFDYEKVTDITPDLPATLTKDRQQGYVLYRPGNHKPGKMTCSRDYGHTPEFQDWRTWRQAVNDGKTDRRTVTVKLKSDDGSVVKSWIFGECEPVQLDVSADRQAETLTCSIGSITLSARESKTPSVSEVVVTKANRNGIVSSPIWWDSWSGGELELLNKWSFQGAQYHEDTPGGLLVEPLTLTGNVMDGRQAIYEWLNSALNGDPWIQSLTLRESPSLPPRGKPANNRTFTFYDCFPTRYVFPILSTGKVVGGIHQVDGLSSESDRIEIKPIRVEMK